MFDTSGRVASEPSDPLSFAAEQRQRDAVRMVEAAIGAGQVMLAYQPVVLAAEPPRASFYEGLIRVLDRKGRIIPARDFIFEIETTELGRRLDALALKLGLKALAENAELRLSINMSARSIDYPPWMRELDRGLGADPTVGERLILEITESSAISVPRLVRDFVERLQERGIAFALDDFGSGYTSMRYLREFCVDILKMDGEFCRGVAGSPDNQAIIRAIVSLGGHFDLVVIAESVENAADAAVLRELGVDCMQGYLFGAPTTRPDWHVCRMRQRGG